MSDYPQTAINNLQSLISDPDCAFSYDIYQVLRLLAETQKASNAADAELSNLSVNKTIAESDRDDRRRRMDIAKEILDETVVTDLDAIAAILWPVPPVAQWDETGMNRLADTLQTQDGQPIYRFGSQVQSVPFQVGECTCLKPFSTVPGDHHKAECALYVAPIDQPTHLPKPGDRFVSWDCVTMGHKWGDPVGDAEDTLMRTCLSCRDIRPYKP